ncbi:adenylosuccinate lyase [Kosmotoga arenicorallina S304]|uniref:Adenylosuccinate lyase n=1 Tax=Kosmotoga arenicorallina S304 TaxID=1453497 RepID=A0A176JZE4_9BACT|nr:adenylosuccinate lyase [Kosmotoga arenicorallina]OAA29436.1 adenylosuccinate lyase [Kosmotoga arenicorallina S304]
MIGRYALSPLKEIWEEKRKYERWLQVELAVIEAFEREGTAPKGTAEKIKAKAHIDVLRIHEIEAEVDHDVIAFIKAVTENLGDEARFFHKGLTSSDVVDTALSLALVETGKFILEALDEFSDALKNKAKEHRKTIIMGRTHGVHAEPTSFGLKMLSFLAEAERNRDRLYSCLDRLAVGKLSGAVGNYANISPEIEKIALERLGLKPTKLSTQVIPRDIHAEFLSVLALIGSGIERLAVEIRHLQKTEVLEVQEPFKEKQRGSSAMPHKKNPILSERLSGMARLLRSYAQVEYENIPLWHERDISHSSTERIVFPDATMLAYYMLKKASYLVKNLTVNQERMLENFSHSKNLVFSQRVMLALVEKGMSREKAYKLIQKLSDRTWYEGIDFKKVVLKDPTISEYLKTQEISELFNPSYYLRNVEKIYRRFGL